MSVKIEDKESIEYWKDRAAFLESVIYELREAIKDEREDEASRISQLEIGLGQIYKIVERLVKGGL